MIVSVLDKITLITVSDKNLHARCSGVSPFPFSALGSAFLKKAKNGEVGLIATLLLELSLELELKADKDHLK
jgi:hypothetical protein